MSDYFTITYTGSSLSLDGQEKTYEVPTPGEPVLVDDDHPAHLTTYLPKSKVVSVDVNPNEIYVNIRMPEGLHRLEFPDSDVLNDWISANVGTR